MANENRWQNRRIRVTDEHIASGMPENSSACMIAEALKTAYPDATRVQADMQTLRLTGPDGVRRTYLTPGAVQVALVRFDAGDPVEPFTFTLRRAIHLNKAITGSAKGIEKRLKDVRKAGTATSRARIGGKPVPVIGTGTRRKFGIRGLRINAEGQVQQIGVEK